MAKRNIKVAVKRLEDGKTYRFNSIKECANELKLSETAIQNCLRGKWKQTKGYELIRVEDIPEELVWIWIGTKYHQVDKIANVLGMHLGKKYRLKSMFVNGSNIKETVEMCNELRSDKTRKFKFIAIDVGLCETECLMLRTDGGLKPSSGIREQNLVVGDMGYIINISNVYKHIKDRNPKELLKENYIDRKVIKKTNKIISRIYTKLDSTLQALGGE